MSEDRRHESAEYPAAPKPREKWSVTTIVLVILAGLLAFSCLTCVVGGWWVMRPGKAIPPTDFITEKTQGIVVLRADTENPALRQFMVYAVDSALKHGVVKDESARQFLQGIKSQGKSPIPSVTAVGSYAGRSAKDVKAFAALVLSEMPRLVRIGLDRSFGKFAKDAGVEEHEGASIVPGNEVAKALNGVESLPPAVAAILDASFVSVSESCMFIGRQKEDVRAGLDAFAAPDPGESSQWMFMQLYGQADSTATIYGALSNEDNLLVAALAPPDRIEEVREQITSAIFLDPQQVSSIVFSVTIMSDDDAVVRLSVTGANQEAASQVAAFVQSLAQANLEAAQKLPLRFVIAESQVTDTHYTAMVNVRGVRALVDQFFAGVAARQQAPPVAPEPAVPSPDATPEAPDEAPAQNP